MKQGWTYKKLGDVCEVINGLWKGKKPPFINVGVIRNANFTKSFTLRYDNIEYLDVEVRQYEKRKLQKGDLIVEKSGGSEKQPVGRAVLFEREEGEFSFSNFTSILRIKDKDSFNSKFLFYFLLFIYKRGDTLGMQKATTGIHNIEFDKYLSISVPVLPLAEQERIVERLDAAFAQIDELKSNAEKQLAEARALFQSALTQAMQPKPGWQEKKIKDIADVKGGKRVPKGYKLQSTKTNHPYIRVADFNNFGTIEMSDIQYISDDIFEQIKNYTITDKDLYVSIAGTIGKTGIIPSELNGANLTENACKLVFKEDINLRFVYLFTLSEIFKKQVEKATKQASQPKLALTRLAEVKISIPSITEQQIIVEHLDALSNNIKELEEICRKTAAECDAMKQALLRQIFE